VAATAIDWDGAVVRDGTLVVGLTEEPTRGWKRRFRGALALLDRTHGDWEAITLRGVTITVPALREGGEGRLRHLLDSAVVEASGDLDAAAPADGERDAQRARDRRMTEALRRPAGG
jgi:hypothetical protein